MKFKPTQHLNVSIALSSGIQPVGRLAIFDHQIFFEYEASFVASGLEISPIALPLKPGLTVCENRIFEGLFGVFFDSLPDGWGRLLLDRYLYKNGITPQQLTSLDRLALVGKDGIGALIYEPSYSEKYHAHSSINLDILAAESKQMLMGDSDVVFTDLLELNGSSGGARPKILVGVHPAKKQLLYGVDDLPTGWQHWLIKFANTYEPKDIGNIEFAYSNMAKAAGLEIMPTHLFQTKKGGSYFGVQRFDRIHNERVHIHSAAGLLYADFRLPSLDYRDLLKLTFILCKDMREVIKMYRLCVFNVFAHNRDDHSKNFSFLMDDKGAWRVSPAYDLTFSFGPGGEHSTSVMGEGRNPTHAHLNQLAKQIGISHKDAETIQREVSVAIRQWKVFATNAAVSKKSLARISEVFIR